MENERKSQIIAFVRNQLAQSGQLLNSLTFNTSGESLPYRNVYHTVNNYLHDFVSKRAEPRWIGISGLRGVGKTTLLAQLYTDFGWESFHKFYLPLDQAVDLGFSLQEILSSYEEILGTSFEQLETPVFFFFDEVHYQKNWGLTMKSLYDKSRNVFILTTGSSALSLQANADIARRMVFEKLYPLGFGEYIWAKYQKPLPEGLQERIKKALFLSRSAKEVYLGLSKEKTVVNKYRSEIKRLEIDQYLKYGSLPFSLALSNPQLIYQQIQKTIDNVINKDVFELNAFDKPTLNKLSQLLYALSGADTTSIVKLATTVSLDPKTVLAGLEALEKTDVLMRIYPYGAHYSQVKKPSKYLFTSSAYRAMYYNLTGSVEQYSNYKGKLLEDIIGMYLFRLFTGTLGLSITYDSAENGADFILRLPQGKIVLEVGMGRKGFKQVISTLNKIKGLYGLVISQTELSLSQNDNCLSVPLEYFLLI